MADHTFSADSSFAGLETPRAPTGSLSISALARFEFEPSRANEGTKILMIEWEDDDVTRSTGSGSWRVQWEGKRAVLPVDDDNSHHDTHENESEIGGESEPRRVYFLLPPNVPIPPVIHLLYDPAPSSTTPAHSLALNTLPAIFPPELGDTAVSAGKKGVLHTIWAKKRLQSLDREIRAECQSNVEGIALHMALQEREWIEMHFGVSSSSTRDSAETERDVQEDPPGFTPISPSGSGKLGTKLRGLKLRTGGLPDTTTTTNNNNSNNNNHLLSPQSPDVAISSFNSFHSLHPTQPNPNPNPNPTINPVLQDHHDSTHDYGLHSLTRKSSAESGEELFAKALSPRSPDLARSPFSFAS